MKNTQKKCNCFCLVVIVLAFACKITNEDIKRYPQTYLVQY